MDQMLKKALKPTLLAALTALGVACGSAQSADNAVADANDNNINPIEANVPTPLMNSSTHLATIVTLQDDPNMQMILYEYCMEVDDNLRQCMLFDGDKKDSKLMGVEYIIKEEKYNALPEDEKAMWHSHREEVLNATIIAPGLSDDQEKDLMKDLMTTYGKMFITMQEGQEVPMGQSKLAMPLAEGEARQDILDKFSSDLGVDLNQEKEARKELAGEEHPVMGDEGTGDTGTGGEGTGDVGTGDETADEGTMKAKGDDTADKGAMKTKVDDTMKAKEEPTQQAQQSQAMQAEPKKAEEPKQAQEPKQTQEPKQAEEPVKAKQADTKAADQGQSPLTKTTKDQSATKTAAPQEPVAQSKTAAPQESMAQSKTAAPQKPVTQSKTAAPQEPMAKSKTKTQEPAQAVHHEPMASKQGQQSLKKSAKPAESRSAK